MLFTARRLGAAAAGVAAVRVPAHCHAEEPNRKPPTKNFSTLRRTNFPIKEQWYGKMRVRVMKVRQEAGGDHSVAEYTVQTKMFGDSFAKSYTDGDNRDCIATDTQKNSVYLVAKRTSAPSPEQFGIDLARHFLNEYPQVSRVEIEVKDHPWDRAVIAGQKHEHGFLRSSPMQGVVTVKMSREKRDYPEVTSKIEGLQVLKTTQCGWENYHRDRYTTLGDTDERLVCTEVSVDWSYMPKSSGAQPDYVAVRQNVLDQVHLGFFGPAKGGVYSPSVQSTVYDIGCMVLEAEPDVSTVTLNAPNLHQLPQKDLLQKLGEKFENDIYLPTSEPSGTIMVTVGREAGEDAGSIQQSARVDAEAVKADIRTALINMKSNACPMAMRVAWHSAGTWNKVTGTGGSDGATMRFEPEFSDGANAGLTMMIDMLKPVKDKHPNVSRADIWAYAGALGIEFLGGPKVPFAFGRSDATGKEQGCPSMAIPENGRLPDALQGAQHLREVFGRQGFNDREIVALSGGHTLGRCHKVRSGFDGPWTDQPLKFDNSYYKHLMDLDWQKRNWDGKEQYEDVETKRLVMLPTDMALKTDPVFSKIAREYADNQDAFFADFAMAFSKLIHNGCKNKPPEIGAAASCPRSASSSSCPSLGRPAAIMPTDKKRAGLQFREYAMHGSTERMKPFAKLADVHEKEANTGRTALHKAAFWGHNCTTDYLVGECRLDPNVQDNSGDTPLHDAVRFGHAGVVDKLLKAGADKTIKNKDGKNAEDIAKDYGKQAIAASLARRR